MRKLILVVHTTLDGHMAGPRGELDWMVHDPRMNHEIWLDLRDSVETMLAGRNAYEGFEAHFRQQATDPESPPDLVDFATWIIYTPKVIFSRTLTSLRSTTSRLAEADISDEVASLKWQPGKDLVLFSGVSTVQSCVRHRLIDEYWIKLHPVAIGRGQTVFPDLGDRAGMTLIGSKTYDSGIVVLRYRPA
ncbi:MAG: dihydrofolate reductase family protein [Chloroflexota bacterium]|nr:dihydrofolate reductase family protein [Chloroflexota bacterium]